MPVPKRKQSKTSGRTRRAQVKLRSPTLVACQQCREMIPPHSVCPHCGYYKGREIMRQETK